jgi:hypothetical protein
MTHESENLAFGQYGIANVGGHTKNCQCSFCRSNKGDSQTIRRFLHGRSDKPKRLLITNLATQERQNTLHGISWKTINGNRIMTGGSYYPNPDGQYGGQKKRLTHSKQLTHMSPKALGRIEQMRNMMNKDLLKLNENNPQDKRQVETLRINISELDKTIKNNT